MPTPQLQEQEAPPPAISDPMRGPRMGGGGGVTRVRQKAAEEDVPSKPKRSLCGRSIDPSPLGASNWTSTLCLEVVDEMPIK